MSANSITIPSAKKHVIDQYSNQIAEIVKKWRYYDHDGNKKIEEVRLWLSNFECTEIPDVFNFLDIIYLVDEVKEEEFLQTIVAKIKNDFSNDLTGIKILSLEEDRASSGSRFLYKLGSWVV